MISTELSRTACTVRSWARNASRRCTSATERATGSRWSAQSKALSPPPTMTTSLSTYGWNDGTKNSRPATEPAVARRERARAELADAGGDDDGARVDLGAVVEADGDGVAVVLEGLRGAVEVVDRPRGGRLRHQPLDQLLALDRREAGHVEDRLLGVHRRHLAAELGQAVDDGDPQPAEPGVVGGVETGGAGSDDQHVGVGRHEPIQHLRRGLLNRRAHGAPARLSRRCLGCGS